MYVPLKQHILYGWAGGTLNLQFWRGDPAGVCKDVEELIGVLGKTSWGFMGRAYRTLNKQAKGSETERFEQTPLHSYAGEHLTASHLNRTERAVRKLHGSGGIYW